MITETSTNLTTLEKALSRDQMPYEVKALDNDQFLKVRETLTRIGISKTGENTLWQSCHLLHKKGRYYICHFKHMFILDGKAEKTNLTENDMLRLSYVVYLLKSWGLVVPLDKVDETSKVSIRIIHHSDKDNWILQPKYNKPTLVKKEETHD